MCEIAKRIQMKESGAAFKSMEGAKNRIDGVGIRWVGFENEEALFDALQQFNGLAVEFPEKLLVFREVETHGRLVCCRGCWSR